MKARTLGQSRRMGWGRGWKAVQDGGDACTPGADSCQCMAKTTTILQSNYPPIKLNKLNF